MKSKHIPVLSKEVTAIIQPKKGGVYVDATLGGGGHLKMLIDNLEGKSRKVTKFIALDQDEEAIERFVDPDKENIEIQLFNENFEDLKKVLEKAKIKKIDGILADLGTSQDQIEGKARGFSFQRDEPLDMRMDKDAKVTAADLVNGLNAQELINLFTRLSDLGDVARKLAKGIIKEREKQPILTTKQLVNVIHQAVHRAQLEARVFQALRIAVNHELDSLRHFLPQAFETLDAKGKFVVISFHSGEDRLVKKYFKELVREKKAKYLAELISPSSEEIIKNSRSSSAKLRSIEKL